MSAVVCEHNPELKLDAELLWILGRPGFTVRGVAETLRAAGVVCARKHEDEQAVAIHWMLKHYLAHGPEKWRDVASAELQALFDKFVKGKLPASPEAGVAT